MSHLPPLVFSQSSGVPRQSPQLWPAAVVLTLFSGPCFIATVFYFATTAFLTWLLACSHSPNKNTKTNEMIGWKCRIITMEYVMCQKYSVHILYIMAKPWKLPVWFNFQLTKGKKFWGCAIFFSIMIIITNICIGQGTTWIHHTSFIVLKVSGMGS